MKELLFILAACAVILGCKNNSSPDNSGNHCFSLMQFVIKDSCLISMLDTLMSLDSPKEDEAMVMELMTEEQTESTEDHRLEYDVVFCVAKKEDVALKHIFLKNRRIVGYLETAKGDVVLLTNIDSQHLFASLFQSVIKPKNSVKEFDYIYYPEDQYLMSDYGTTPNDTIDEWGMLLLYDPIYLCYRITEHGVYGPAITRNLKETLNELVARQGNITDLSE